MSIKCILRLSRRCCVTTPRTCQTIRSRSAVSIILRLFCISRCESRFSSEIADCHRRDERWSPISPTLDRTWERLVGLIPKLAHSRCTHRAARAKVLYAKIPAIHRARTEPPKCASRSHGRDVSTGETEEGLAVAWKRESARKTRYIRWDIRTWDRSRWNAFPTQPETRRFFIMDLKRIFKKKTSVLKIRNTVEKRVFIWKFKKKPKIEYICIPN